MQVNVGLHNFMVKLAYVDVKKDSWSVVLSGYSRFFHHYNWWQ
jgi:hypothetical protein